MSGPESGSASGPPPGITCASLPADIIELAALRERTQVLKALAARRGLALPSVGWIITARETLVVCVRPERWLLLSAPNLPGAALAGWRTAGAGCAAAIELSSALTALYLAALPFRKYLPAVAGSICTRRRSCPAAPRRPTWHRCP